MVTQAPLILPPKKYSVFQGGTGGDMIGPVVLPDAAKQWTSTWAEKKTIYGPDHFIDVGGKLETDAPEHKRKKQRTDDSLEPVFFHSLPELFWTEVAEAFSIIGVVDLCPGEGTCAMACYRKLLPYVGVCFTEQHAARLQAYLEKLILSCMTSEGDSLYDVRFANALSAGLGEPAKPLPKPKPAPKPKATAPTAPVAPPGADPIGDEAQLSGDEGH